MSAACLANFCDGMLLGSWWSDVTFGLEMFPLVWWINLKAGLLLGSAWAIMGIATVWAVWGRERWPVRAAGAIGLFWLLIPLNVPDAAWLHCLQVAFVGLSVLAARGVSIWLRRRKRAAGGEELPRSAFQFTTVDLLWLMVACATTVSGLILLNAQPMTSSWESRLTFSGHGAGVILATMWLVFGKRIWPVRAILFFGSVLATMESCYVTVLVAGRMNMSFYWTGFALFVPLINLSGAVLLWLGIVAGRVWYDCKSSSDESALVRSGLGKWKRTVATVVLLLLAAPGVVLYVNLLWPLPPKETAEKGENHWDELVARCGGFERLTPLDVDADPPAAFVTSYQTHQVDVAEIQRLLGRPGRRRLQYDMTDCDYHYIQQMRGAARAMGAAGNGQIVLGQWDEAAQTFGDIVRLGDATARGGLLIDHMIGSAIEGMGQIWIIRFSDKFSSAQCRGLLATLVAVEAQRESPEVVSYRDRVWEMHASIPGSRVQEIIAYPWNRDLSKRPPQYLYGFQCRDAQLRLVMCHLAIRVFVLEHGRPPAALAEFVPEYLPAVPLDPFDGQPMRYRIGEDGKPLVYSVGPDGVDEGGRIVRLPELNQEGDASLESFFSELFPSAATPSGGTAGDATPLSESEPPLE